MDLNSIIENILQALATGLLLGAIYGLMCVGLSLIFGVMRVTNFAQGEFLMLGMYGSLYLCTRFGLGDLLGAAGGPVASALLSGAGVYLAGIALHRMLLQRFTGTQASAMSDDGHHSQLIVTLALSLILSNGALILFGSSSQSIQTALSSSAWEIGIGGDSGATVFLNKARVAGAIVSVLATIACYSLITRTRMGKTLRAAAANPHAAKYMGIDVDKAHRIAFGLGVAGTAVAGGMVAAYYPFQPYVGGDFVIIMFAGVVLGGLGSVTGAFWGGLTIGLIQQMSSLVLPQQLQNAAIFVAFLMIVVLRPQGLFGRNVERV
jgi:branched-chain amino acid transport system permease protein